MLNKHFLLSTFVLINILLKLCFDFSGFFEQEVQKNSIYLKSQSFVTLSNVFTVTFDQSNALLLNKMIYLFLQFPHFGMVV